MWLLLLQRLRDNPFRSCIIATVLIAHLFFVCALFFSSSIIPIKQKRKALKVHTAVLNKQPERIASASKPASPLQKPKPPVKKQSPPIASTPKTAPAPVKKQAVKSPTPEKKAPPIADKTISRSTPPPPPPRAKISDSLLQELEESIAKIENKSDKPKVGHKTLAGKTAPIALQIDALEKETPSTDKGSYAASLVNHLHQHLSLPEYGEVTVQLSLRQDGSVVKVVVLKSQSEKNRQYLESNLMRLKFPRFEGSDVHKREETFVLTFCNEI